MQIAAIVASLLWSLLCPDTAILMMALTLTEHPKGTRITVDTRANTLQIVRPALLEDGKNVGSYQVQIRFDSTDQDASTATEIYVTEQNDMDGDGDFISRSIAGYDDHSWEVQTLTDTKAADVRFFSPGGHNTGSMDTDQLQHWSQATAALISAAYHDDPIPMPYTYTT